MIVSNMENPFFVDVYKGAERDARANGYELVLANTGYDPENLVNNIRLMIGRRVAGLALVISEMDTSLVQELSQSKIPVVFYDVGAPKHNFSNITVNYAKGIERVVNYLLDLGHRRVAFISHHRSLGPLSVREHAFRETVQNHSASIEWRIAASMDGLDGGRQATREILASGFNPSALICVNDFMALGALHELREAGLRIPQDVSVTGFDNIRLAEVSFPPLTTLHIPREHIGQMMFQDLITPSPVPEACGRRLVLEPEFVLRGSTGPAR